jgi:hypothetical protein
MATGRVPRCRDCRRCTLGFGSKIEWLDGVGAGRQFGQGVGLPEVRALEPEVKRRKNSGSLCEGEQGDLCNVTFDLFVRMQAHLWCRMPNDEPGNRLLALLASPCVAQAVLRWPHHRLPIIHTCKCELLGDEANSKQ